MAYTMKEFAALELAEEARGIPVACSEEELRTYYLSKVPNADQEAVDAYVQSRLRFERQCAIDYEIRAAMKEEKHGG